MGSSESVPSAHFPAMVQPESILSQDTLIFKA